MFRYYCFVTRFVFIVVYWSCQYIARASNSSLRHWQQMGGVSIEEDMIIDKSIRRSLNSRASVLKVRDLSSSLLMVLKNVLKCLLVV